MEQERQKGGRSKRETGKVKKRIDRKVERNKEAVNITKSHGEKKPSVRGG